VNPGIATREEQIAHREEGIARRSKQIVARPGTNRAVFGNEYEFHMRTTGIASSQNNEMALWQRGFKTHCFCGSPMELP
jgi:hypothetical protein